MRTRPITRWRHAAAAALASCIILAGCGAARPPTAPPGPPPGTLALPVLPPVSGPSARTYLGPVPGTSALIGIVVQGAHARAYLCDGIPGQAVTLADWFTGSVRDGTLDAVSGQHHARLAARLGARTATGTITLPGGTAHPFTVTLTPPGTHAGISEGDGELRGQPYHAGRIVLPGGEQRGAAAFPSGPIRGRATTYVPLRRI